MSGPDRPERLEAEGGVFTRLDGVDLVRDYGDPAAEYRAVREGVGIVLRSDRTQLRMWGRDPKRMLNGLITNDLGRIGPDRAVYGALLTPKGRMIADLRALEWGEGDELLVDIAAAALEPVTEHLKKYVPPLFARWEALDDGVGCLGVYGPRSPELVSALLGEPVAPEEDRVTRADGSNLVVVASRYAGGETGFDLFGEAARLGEVREALLERGRSLGAAPVGHTALETLRIEAGQPSYGAEITDEVLPAEAYQAIGGMERAISFSKGCYTGQEVVVRIAHRGHVNRNLRGIVLGDAAVPEPGTSLLRADGEKEVGRITSAARSPLAGGTVALGYVRREIEPGAEVRVGSGGATGRIVALPFGDPA